MKIFKTILLFSFLLTPILLRAQKFADLKISILPVFSNSIVLANGTFYKTTDTDSITFETLKFYISGIVLQDNEIIAWTEENSFHLIDLSDTETMALRFGVPAELSFNKIKFNLGIDSAANVSGALGGDLDPTKGMYWTWQNGYINFKLEGKSNLCTTRNKAFEFHLGGYQFPNNSLQTVTLTCNPNENINIRFDLEKFLGQVDLTKENQIMSPGNDAVLLSQKAALAFSIKK